jgi:hypothetical protein
MIAAAKLQQELDHFTGSQGYHSLGPLTKNVVMTDGVAHLFHRDAAWIVTDLVAHMTTNRKLKADEELRYFQIWTLVVKDRQATLTCKADSGRKPVVTQRYERTDFPLDEITIYAETGSVADRSKPEGFREVMVLMLPSER